MRGFNGSWARKRIAALAVPGVLALLAAATVLATSAQPAAAAGYDVEVCTPSSGNNVGAQLEFVAEAGSSNFFLGGCFPFSAPGEPALDIVAKSGTVTGGSHWKINAPAGALIRSIQANRTLPSFAGAWNGGMRWAVFEGPPEEELFELDDSTFLPADGPVTWTPTSPTPSFTGRLFCPFASCNNSLTEVQILFSDVIAHMVDDNPPAVTPAGPLFAGGPMRGTKEASFAATDQGSGIAKVSLLVDDSPLATVTDLNSNKCKKPYKFLAPCKTAINSAFNFDTSAVADGDHKVEVAVEDAAGQVTGSAPVTVTVHNGPTNTTRPLLSGTAKIGGQLAATPGAWEGSPTFAYQWLLCPAKVITVQEAAACKPIPGATKPQYELAAADVYQRDVVKVTATNTAGAESVFSTPSDLIADAQGRTAPPSGSSPDTTAPVLTKLSLSRKRFRIAKAPGNAASKGKAGRGTLLRFSSTEAGQLSIVIERERRGRKPTPSATLTSTIQAGRSNVAVSGRIGKKRLTPGNYRMTITARDAAGNASQATRLPFTILPG
jgi:hypothetical protein